MSPMTSALISYWQRLPAESPVARREFLDLIRDRVRAGREPRSALVPFALGDVDDGIVAAATRAYVAAGSGPADVDALHEATEWVRRGLALNRGAVFGALLGLEDERALERLAALRLVLTAAEVAATGRALGPQPGPLAVAFLRDWADLVAGGDLQRESQALQRIVGEGFSARPAAASPSKARARCRATLTCRAACGRRATRTPVNASARAARRHASR